MQETLAQAGIRPPLLRALGWAALFWVVSLLLPVRVEASGAVWALDLLGTTSGNAAVLAMLFAAGASGVLSLGLRSEPTSSRALMAFTAAAVGLAGVLSDPDTQASLLPFLPGALSRGYVALVVGIAAAAASLRAERMHRALFFGAIAAGATVWLYLWPHPFGALWTEALSSTRVAIAPPPELARGAASTRAALAALPGLLIGVSILVRAFALEESRRVVAGWVLAAIPATLIAVGLKSAAAFGADSFVLVGLRGAAIFLALTVSVAFGLEAFTAHAPTRGSRRFRAVGHTLTLAGLAWALAPHVKQPQPLAWPILAPPAWASTLYADALPHVALAASEVDLPGGQAALAAAVREAALGANEAPELRDAIWDLGRWSENPGRHRRRLEAVGDRLNDAARAAGLPFYVDVRVTGFRGGATRVQWVMQLETYRIERARRFSVSGRERASLWLDRLDPEGARDARLGWTRHDAPEGMVILDVIRDHWRQDLAPALAGVSGRTRRARAYRRHARVISEDLATALRGRVPADALGQLLDCVGPAGRAPKERRQTCAAVRVRVEPEVLRVLAEKVETHELRHAADGARLAPPMPLLDAMPGYAEASVQFAAAELSAYLAETANSALPRLALVHFVALAEAQPRSPEGFAGRVAAAAIGDITGLSMRALLARPGAEVAAAAALAHERLFGAPLMSPVALDSPPPPLPSDTPPAV